MEVKISSQANKNPCNTVINKVGIISHFFPSNAALDRMVKNNLREVINLINKLANRVTYDHKCIPANLRKQECVKWRGSDIFSNRMWLLKFEISCMVGWLNNDNAAVFGYIKQFQDYINGQFAKKKSHVCPHFLH